MGGLLTAPNKEEKMIITTKSLTEVKDLQTKQLNIEKPKLVARWRKVDGKLICSWILA